MIPFSATPDGRVLIAYHYDGPVDTKTAGIYARYLEERGDTGPAAILRAVIILADTIAMTLRYARAA